MRNRDGEEEQEEDQEPEEDFVPAPHTVNSSSSTFDAGLFDALVYACVNHVPAGKVTTYGTYDVHDKPLHNFHPCAHMPWLIHTFSHPNPPIHPPNPPTHLQAKSHASATTPSTPATSGKPCAASHLPPRCPGNASSTPPSPFRPGATAARAHAGRPSA